MFYLYLMNADQISALSLVEWLVIGLVTGALLALVFAREYPGLPARAARLLRLAR